MTEQAWTAIIGQLGIAGIFAVFMWHLITKGIPDLISGFRAELAEERASRKEQHRANVDSLERLGERMDRLTEAVETCHCRPAPANSGAKT